MLNTDDLALQGLYLATKTLTLPLGLASAVGIRLKKRYILETVLADTEALLSDGLSSIG